MRSTAIMHVYLHMVRQDQAKVILLLDSEKTKVLSLVYATSYFTELNLTRSFQAAALSTQLFWAWLRFTMREFKIFWLKQVNGKKTGFKFERYQTEECLLREPSLSQFPATKKFRLKSIWEQKTEPLLPQTWIRLRHVPTLWVKLFSNKKASLKMERRSVNWFLVSTW